MQQLRSDVIKWANKETSVYAWNQPINNPDVNTFRVMPHGQPVWSLLETQSNPIPHVMDSDMSHDPYLCSAMRDEVKHLFDKQGRHQRWDENLSQKHHRPYSPRVYDRSANRGRRSLGNRNSEVTRDGSHKLTKNYRQTFHPVVLQTRVTPKSEGIESGSAYIDTTGRSKSQEVQYAFRNTHRQHQRWAGHLAPTSHEPYSLGGTCMYDRSARGDRRSEEIKKVTYQQTINGRAFKSIVLQRLATPRSQDISNYASFTTSTKRYNKDDLQTRSVNTFPQIRNEINILNISWPRKIKNQLG